MNARDLMTTGVETVHPDDEVSEVLTRLARADFNGFPVVDDDERVVGIVTQHDLVHLFQPSDRTLWIPVGFPPFLETLEYAIDLSWDRLDTELDLLKYADEPIREIMTDDVVTVSSEKTAKQAAQTMLTNDIEQIPLVSGDELVGIVRDINLLEAIQ